MQRSRQDVLDTMERIVEQTASHFEHEERLLIDHAYPAEAEHARIHAELMDKLNRALQEMRDSDPLHRWTDIAQGVDSLLREHIENEDSKYIEYLRIG